MPHSGSQIFLCDIPIRFDTYKGCSHGCKYCFTTRKYDINKINKNEGVESLRRFINGKRIQETSWCDWNIPLHWGGMSDPFQPCERKYEISYKCLRILEETKYPFVVSTKSTLIAKDKYLELIKNSNCVVQFSACCKEYDLIEPNAPSFKERIKAAKVISSHKRVIIRVQPYIRRTVPRSYIFVNGSF